MRERVIAQLANVDATLASGVAAGLGIEVSPALSLRTRPTESGIAGRRVAILVSDGVHGESVRWIYHALAAAGAAPRYVGQKLGLATPQSGDAIAIDVTIEAAPSVLFDAVVLPDGLASDGLANDGHAVQFVKDAYRHCKPILALGSGAAQLEAAGIPETLPDGAEDPGLLKAQRCSATASTNARRTRRWFEPHAGRFVRAARRVGIADLKTNGGAPWHAATYAVMTIRWPSR